MIIYKSFPKRSAGFSLIEILIAVVVLATGLLALTALQGSLTKASAEAKVRGRVAAFMAGQMESLRNGPYDSIVDASGACTPTTGTGFVASNVCADAGLGSLSATQTVETWAGQTSFSQTTTPITDPKLAQFKRITLTATWTDSSGAVHTLRGVSDISPLGLVTNLIVPPDSDGSGGGSPVVRQNNPITDGMIPVALGDGSSSAASNPKPELKQDGQNQRIVGTRFNVLNYIPEGTDRDSSARIQKRFENELVRCRCSMGADTSPSTSIYYNAQWPAVWTGDRYDVYVPDPPSTAAPGQAKRSAPISGVTQSDVCTQCCRDHHDSTTGVKFDPERTLATGEATGTEKYSRNSSTGVYSISTGDYIQACRIIRVDGFWRVASDTYARQVGLLPTTTVSNVAARSGALSTGVSGSYSDFVKAYSLGYQSITASSSGTAPTGADAAFNAASPSLNAPAIVVDPPNRSNDWRYLHARGLYVDYLERDARQRLADAVANCTRVNRYDCILPYLPFTTINLTELAKWLAEDDDVLQVNSGNIMSSNPLEPFGGRTKGIAATTGVGDGSSPDDENIVSALKSNSGLAVYAEVRDLDGDGVPDILTREQFGIDPQDDTQVAEDRQAFQVIGNTNTGNPFYIRSTTSTSTTARYSLGGSDSDDCTNMAADPDGNGPIRDTDIKCITQSTSSAMAGSFTLSNYWSEAVTRVQFDIGATQCTVIGTGFTGLNNKQVDNVPVFTNYRVSGVSSANATITSAMPVPADDLTKDGKITEATTVYFTGASANAIFDVSYSIQRTVQATIGTCTVTQGNGSNWTLTVNSWVKPWEQP